MTFSFKKHKDELLFLPLGGSNEVGMNLNLYHYKGKWLMVDLGMGFADDWYPGVDLVVPDIRFITERKEDLLGIVITHAHEDHIGAVPYLWHELQCPVFATPFAASVLKAKFADMQMSRTPEIIELKPGSKWNVEPFGVEFVPITHSIPEMNGVAIRTDKGIVFHTGDWKLDPNPVVGDLTDEKRLTELGKEGVLALVCDSTNVFVEGESGSEGDVRESLVKLVGECKGRVAITTFASNVARLESVVHAASVHGRRVALVGRSLWRISGAAQDCGYLQGVEFIGDREAEKLPPEEVLYLCTGCQGERRAAITKISRGEHPFVRFRPGDTVIFSSRVIPGNEKKLYRLFNTFVKKGIEVLTEKDHFVHVSGHPARGELTRMYQMIKPKIAVPTHGEARHLHEHAKLAKTLQVPEAVEAENGTIIRLEEGKAEIIGEVDAGYMVVDGSSIIPGDGKVMKTRRKIVSDGLVVVSLALGKKNRMEAHPRVAAPGLLDEQEDADLLSELEDEVADALERMKPDATRERLAETVKVAVRRVLGRELDKKPVVETLVAKVK